MEKWFEEEKKNNIKPSIVTYTAMIEGYAKLGYTDSALKIFDQLSRDPSVQPNSVTYDSLLGALAKKGDMEIILKYLEEMKSKGFPPSDITYNIMIKACYETAKITEMEEIFAQMKKEQIQPDLITFTTMFTAYAVHRPLDGLKLFEEFTLSKIQLNNTSLASLELLLQNILKVKPEFVENSAVQKLQKLVAKRRQANIERSYSVTRK